jgi:uncharacterized coiled-coil protein SlyX
MATLVSALNQQESVDNRTNKLSNRRDGIELNRLLAAAQYDIAVLQANYAALLTRLDTIATTAGASAITGTAFGSANRNTYGPDVPGTTQLTSTTFLP